MIEGSINIFAEYEKYKPLIGADIGWSIRGSGEVRDIVVGMTSIYAVVWDHNSCGLIQFKDIDWISKDKVYARSVDEFLEMVGK